jgi:hypothetical protein
MAGAQANEKKRSPSLRLSPRSRVRGAREKDLPQRLIDCRKCRPALICPAFTEPPALPEVAGNKLHGFGVKIMRAKKWYKGSCKMEREKPEIKLLGTGEFWGGFTVLGRPELPCFWTWRAPRSSA